MAEQSEASSNLSQADYVSSSYSDGSWEIVGETKQTDEFEPMDVEVIDRGGFGADPFFQDYGGIGKEKGARRWHLPEESDYTAKINKKKEAALEADRSQSFTPEQLEQIKAEAFAAGATQAQAQAQAAHAAELASIGQRITTMLSDLQTQNLEQLQENEKQCVELALEVSKLIIQHAVEVNPEYIVELVKEAIRHSGSAAIKTVRVSPSDLEFIEYINLKEKLKESGGAWKFEADPSVSSGCIIDSSAGEIDYQMDHAWQRVKDKVVKVIR